MANEIDDRLHAERVGAGDVKARYETAIDDLPDGVFVPREGDEGPCGWCGAANCSWSPGGYRERRPGCGRRF